MTAYRHYFIVSTFSVIIPWLKGLARESISKSSLRESKDVMNEKEKYHRNLKLSWTWALVI